MCEFNFMHKKKNIENKNEMMTYLVILLPLSLEWNRKPN